MTNKPDTKDIKKNDKETGKTDFKSKDAGSKNSDDFADDVILNEDVRIQVGEPLPYFDKGTIKAYRAISGSKHGTNLFALICTKSLTPRFLSRQKYTNINNPNLCTLVQSGKVFWPPEGQECYCFVYEDTLGHPIIDRNDKNPALGWKPEIVLSNIIAPMISVLVDFRNKELFHGEIWPGNMFDGGAKAGQKINLGECLSTPAASQLPSLYEPIERALADAYGRGSGDISDDLYSFGASLAVMLRSEDPMKGVSEDKIIEYKIEKGSYAVLFGNERLSGAILELIRGLLYDDPEHRWTIEDLEAWQDGRRLSPKQSPKRVKAMRPIVFRSHKYIRPELLAKDLYLDTAEALKLVETNELNQWVERAIEDKMVKSRLEQSLDYITSYERGGSYNDRATVAVAHGLYPECPVRYKNIHFQPHGFGKYLTLAYVDKLDIEPFVDVMKYNFLTPIVRESRNLEKGILISNLDSARGFIKQKALNLGLERCLYVLNPETPCLSPIFEKHYVQNAKDMMMAFEDICKKSVKSTILFDRHVVSFLSVKDRQNIDPYVTDLTVKDPRIKILTQLKILATMQKRLNLGGCPAIASWVRHNFEPVLARFHDSKKLNDINKKIDKYVTEGDLKAFAFLFDGASIYESDKDDFFNAMKEYQGLVEEQRFINKELSKGNQYGQNTGRQIASVISMIISFMIMMLSVYKTFWGG